MRIEEGGFLERRIVTGMVISTEYLQRIQRFWDPDLLESPELRLISDWCLDYFSEYKQAPDNNIESLYMMALKRGFLSKASAQYIEGVLTNLSEEYGRGMQFNAAYLFDQTVKYLKTRELEKHNEEIQELIDGGQVEEAEKLALSFVPSIAAEMDVGLELSSREALDRIKLAFDETSQRVISYPGALGNMWNEHLIRGGFVSLLAPEKRGKTFWLLELSLRAVRQKANVVFFAAGDMTEAQMLKRICVYIARRSDREKYCQERFTPVGDCILNQLDLCKRSDRNCDHGIFENLERKDFEDNFAKHINLEKLQELYEEYPDYQPCDSHSCDKRKGSIWVKKTPQTNPLTGGQARKHLRSFFKKYKRRFKLATYPAGVLTVGEIKKCLDAWERYDGFVPDVVVVDYADLLSAGDSKISEYRHRQDHVWKNLRALSQERHVLLLTATQADAKSYTEGRLSLANFSEDKRKFAHVTAQYGLNQDPKGWEKKLQVMRINEIVVREGEFSADNQVFVLHDLAIGRPFLESFTR